MLIEFHSDSLNFTIDKPIRTSNWLLEVFKSETSLKEVSLNIVFCTDEELLEINKNFLQHDYFTDIITFPIEETNDYLEAELYISVDRVRDNSNTLNITFEKELYRVMVHGVLHLCGYKDKSDKDKVEMRSKEDFYLAGLI